jgi:hypothetical protein
MSKVAVQHRVAADVAPLRSAMRLMLAGGWRAGQRARWPEDTDTSERLC